MKTYIVNIPNIFINKIEVQAEDEESAKKLAEEVLKENSDKKEFTFEYFYQGTLKFDSWHVIEKAAV